MPLIAAFLKKRTPRRQKFTPTSLRTVQNSAPPPHHGKRQMLAQLLQKGRYHPVGYVLVSLTGIPGKVPEPV